MKIISLSQFIITLQTHYEVITDKKTKIFPHSFLRELHHERNLVKRLIYELGHILHIPISPGRINDFLQPGTSYNVQDIYEEFVQLARNRKQRHFTVAWTIFACLLAPISLYALLHVKIILTLTTATLGSAILAYLHKNKNHN